MGLHGKVRKKGPKNASFGLILKCFGECGRRDSYLAARR
jgi:hypothetical protein